MALSKKTTIQAEEIARFSGHAEEWWNPKGALGPLHRLNPIRLAYLRDQILTHGFGQKGVRQCLKGVSLLDVGCGGGLLSEPLARLGANVTGLDASDRAIAEARRHAAESELKITYRAGSVEELARGKNRYDAITAMEVVEHVADLDIFIAALAQLLKPGGLLILSTLNRTPKSFLLGIVAAEYLLRIVPRGTHHWRQFVRPSELVRKLEKGNCTAVDLTGVVIDPFKGDFVLSKTKLDVNYMLTAIKN